MSPAFRPVFRILLLLLCAAALSSRAESPAGEPAPAPVPLRKGDALLVRIEGLGGGLPEYREIVDRDGNIEVPFLGFLSADGKLPAAIEAEMAASYAEARLGTTAVVRITLVTHFDPPPERAVLIRSEDPRRPVPAPTTPPATK